MQVKTNAKELQKEVSELFKELSRKISSLKPVMQAIGEGLLTNWRFEWKENKNPYGRKWAPLSPSTLRARRKGDGVVQILRDTGVMQSSFTVEAGEDYVAIGTDVRYTEYHQKGTVKMPKRMLVPEKRLPKRDWEYIRWQLREYLSRL